MFNKKIIFCATRSEMADVWPHPQPASKFIPDEYKKLERFWQDNVHEPTVKVCVPFLDSLKSGYIIPFDQDYVVDPVENDFTVTPANREPNNFGFHDKTQLPEKWRKDAGNNAGKFVNKWLIKTPPGYSCLFVQPLNRVEKRWSLYSGVVDTDVYINEINFPFILHKRDKQFIIKKGEPMIQVIPFKREPWKKWSGFYPEKEHGKTLARLKTIFVDRYKKLFWNKKSYK